MLSKAEKTEFLGKTELFSKLSGDILEDMAATAQEVHFGDGDTVFEAGSSILRHWRENGNWMICWFYIQMA
jgi:hypothetical protein